jgi:DNA-binding transcriptional MocR family regulator
LAAAACPLQQLEPRLFDLLSKQRASMIVCSDKVNQLRHLGFLKNKAEVENHMKKHADLVRPKFEAAFNALDAMESRHWKL